jgi:uncharacterized membrane protein HdeD (DUF308 family)
MAADSAPSRSELEGRWGWFAALGVLMMIAGFIALISVVAATVVGVLLVGVMMIFSGIVEIVHGFGMKRWSRFFLWILIGAFYLIAGLLILRDPLLAAGALTLVIGVFLVFAGIARIFLAMQMRSNAPWGWVLVSGIITLLLGIMVIAQWPISSFYVIGIFLGVDLIVAGSSWLAAAVMFRSSARRQV